MLLFSIHSTQLPIDMYTNTHTHSTKEKKLVSLFYSISYGILHFILCGCSLNRANRGDDSYVLGEYLQRQLANLHSFNPTYFSSCLVCFTYSCYILPLLWTASFYIFAVIWKNVLPSRPKTLSSNRCVFVAKHIVLFKETCIFPNIPKKWNLFTSALLNA